MRHHLAIVYPAHLDAILSGLKTAECRLAKAPLPPYRAIKPGDLIWLKEFCGPVRGVATAYEVRSFADLSPERVDWLRRHFNDRVRAPVSFWQSHRQARFATLAFLREVCPLTPFAVAKRDRRAWVVLGRPPIPGQPVVSASAPLA